jgi:hypothetical protein
MKFNEWLMKKYFDWQIQAGKRRSQKEFADYLGVSPSALGQWMDGGYQPRGSRNITRLSEKLGPEVYDLLDLPYPLPPELEAKTLQLVKIIMSFPPGLQQIMVSAVQETALELSKIPRPLDEQELERLFLEMVKKNIS